MKFFTHLILAVLWIAAPVGRVQTGEVRGSVVVGLDHVPIAVSDLEKAAERYERLGFVLKPGQPHANGIRNVHAKFPDGTELELITAPAARDALTAKYRRHLAAGDGPAFLALFVPDKERTPSRPSAPLDYIFFGPRNASPTDRPVHFAHPNGATSLIAVWVAADDVSKERALFERLGATVSRLEVRVPGRMVAEVARFQEGEVLLLPAARQLVPGRRIVGVTVRVKSTAAVRQRLASHEIPMDPSGEADNLFVAPTAAHGLWIEFRAVRTPD